MVPDAAMYMILAKARTENIMVVGQKYTWASRSMTFDKGDPVIAYGGSDQYYYVDVGN